MASVWWVSSHVNTICSHYWVKTAALSWCPLWETWRYWRVCVSVAVRDLWVCLNQMFWRVILENALCVLAAFPMVWNTNCIYSSSKSDFYSISTRRGMRSPVSPACLQFVICVSTCRSLITKTINPLIFFTCLNSLFLLFHCEVIKISNNVTLTNANTSQVIVPCLKIEHVDKIGK